MNRIFLAIVLAASFLACSGDKDAEQKKTVNRDTMKPLVARPEAKNDSIPDGEKIFRDPDGKIKMRGYYVAGQRHGHWQSYFSNGNIQSEGYFKGGVRDGKALVYHENGKLYYEGQYKDGLMVGEWKFFTPEGKLEKTVRYDDTGRLIYK